MTDAEKAENKRKKDELSKKRTGRKQKLFGPKNKPKEKKARTSKFNAQVLLNAIQLALNMPGVERNNLNLTIFTDQLLRSIHVSVNDQNRKALKNFVYREQRTSEEFKLKFSEFFPQKESTIKRCATNRAKFVQKYENKIAHMLAKLEADAPACFQTFQQCLFTPNEQYREYVNGENS